MRFTGFSRATNYKVYCKGFRCFGVSGGRESDG